MTSEAGVGGRDDELIQLEERCHERNMFVEELIALDLSFTFMRGEQDSSVRTEHAPKFAEYGGHVLALEVDDRVEREYRAHGVARDGKRAHIRRRGAVEPTTGEGRHLHAEVETHDAAPAGPHEGSDLARPATDLEDGIGSGCSQSFQ